LAKKLDVTCYDAVYLALAADLDFNLKVPVTSVIKLLIYLTPPGMLN